MTEPGEIDWSKITQPCPQCGRLFSTWRSRVRNGRGRYCSRACVAAARCSIESLSPRFWAKLAASEGCWEWEGKRDRQGYGHLRWAGHGDQRAHRVSYVLNIGPIPEGLDVLHHCDNPPCCRPDHLFVGTQTVNVADMVSKDRQQRRERHYAARLSASDVAEIRRLYQRGYGLGASFGVSQTLVSAIVLGQRWAQ